MNWSILLKTGKARAIRFSTLNPQLSRQRRNGKRMMKGMLKRRAKSEF